MEVLYDFLIPDLVTLVVDYVSLIELADLNVTPAFIRSTTFNRHNEDDLRAAEIYESKPRHTINFYYIPASPDYLRYIAFLRYRNGRIYFNDIPLKTHIKKEPAYMIDWLIQSPHLTWDNQSVGTVLMSAALHAHDDARLLRILQTLHAVYNVNPERLDFFTSGVTRLVYGLKTRSDESLAVSIIQQYGVSERHLIGLLGSTLKDNRTRTFDAILTLIETHQVEIDAETNSDLFEEIIRSHPELIPRFIQLRLFTPLNTRYVHALVECKLELKYVDMVLGIMAHSVSKFEDLLGPPEEFTDTEKMLSARYYELHRKDNTRVWHMWLVPMSAAALYAGYTYMDALK